MSDHHETPEVTGLAILDEALNRQKLSRRFLFDMIGGLAVYVSLPKALNAGVGLFAADKPHGEAHKEGDGKPRYSDDEKLPMWLDLTTALGVSGTFAKQVMHNMLIKGEDLSLVTAMKVNGAHAARVALLRHFGNAEGQELAHHEDYEWGHGLTPVPLLVVLSTFTTADLKANVDVFFPKIEEALEPSFNYKVVDPLPIFDDNIDLWKKRLETVKQDITVFAARVAAVTGALAPLGTTYLSSALADQMKRGMLRMLYEQSLCIEVIAWKEETGSGVSAFTDAQMLEIRSNFRERARKRAYKYFHGPLGFSNMMTALPANASGMWGIGDPPEIFAMLEYYDRPEVLAGSHFVGAGMAASYNIIFMLMWLTRVGVTGKGQFISHSLRDGLKTLGALMRASVNTNTYGRSVPVIEDLAEVLKAAKEEQPTPDNDHKRDLLERILHIVEKTPRQSFHISSDS
ncbi:MAG: hypothetical protein HQL50_15440, partial [Magnetococcales bacterium]|nr:hypothetical protein [Magnetococcales bacterium]